MIPYAKEIIIGIAMIGLTVGGAYLYRGIKASGYNECAAENADAVAKQQADMTTLKAQHITVIEAFQSQLNQTRRKDDEHIKKLLVENAALKAWWTSTVPADAAAFAWGMPDPSDNGAVPGGRGALFGATPWSAP